MAQRAAQKYHDMGQYRVQKPIVACILKSKVLLENETSFEANSLVAV